MEEYLYQASHEPRIGPRYLEVSLEALLVRLYSVCGTRVLHEEQEAGAARTAEHHGAHWPRLGRWAQ